MNEARNDSLELSHYRYTQINLAKVGDGVEQLGQHNEEGAVVPGLVLEELEHLRRQMAIDLCWDRGEL